MPSNKLSAELSVPSSTQTLSKALNISLVEKLPQVTEPDEKTRQPMTPGLSACCFCGLRALFLGKQAKHLEVGVSKASSGEAPTLLQAARRQDKILCADMPSRLPEVMATAADEVMSPKVTRPQLSGRWMQVRFEGDVGQLMVDAGLPWAIRRMAKSMNYGVGKTFTNISQCDDAFELVFEMPGRAPTKMSFVVGEGEWQTASPLVVKPVWEDEVLVMERKTTSGKELPVLRRWVDAESGELVEEVETSKGEKVLRFFAKQ